jgi:photosystem II stability/assembly factor-like uncharacterized protein
MVTAAAPNSAVFYAATEWGGLYQSTDSGQTWKRLDGHRPTVTWRVRTNPSNPQQVFATSLYDGRIDSLAGINVSSDGGRTWTHPAQKASDGFCADSARQAEPSAFGIAIDPDNPRNIYVGTNCGLAVSNDQGATWHRVDPTPDSKADDVWDVIVHDRGIIDICGDDGHLRSTNGAQSFVASNGLPTGECSLAASPIESSVVFLIVGKRIYESDDAGSTWTSNPTPMYQGRIPFVATNRRSANAFDLWFGDIGLYRATCSVSTTGGPTTARCPPPSRWAGPFTRESGAHDDSGSIVFGANGCPLMFSSDGGIFLNGVLGQPGCLTPHWQQPKITPHGLWLFSMDTASLPNGGQALYAAAQDNGTFFTGDARAPRPSWSNRDCCDSFAVVASPQRILYDACCYQDAPANRLFLRDASMSSGGEISKYPPGNVLGWQRHAISRISDSAYAVVTDAGVYTTPDISAQPVMWKKLGATVPADICGIQTSARAGAPVVFYAQTKYCDGSGGRVILGALDSAALYRYDGTSSTGNWKQIVGPDAAGGFGTIAIHPRSPDRLVASFVRPNGDPMIVQSGDAGRTWQPLANLDRLMTRNGGTRYRTTRGPSDFTAFDGYLQATLIEFDPEAESIIIAGAADSGLFYTTDGGRNWTILADPDDILIPRPRFAKFDHGVQSRLLIYVGSQGRGMWRVTIPTSANH